MGSVVCTLFEGHYHYGVAALSNSLYQHGYRGEIFAGYHGLLTNWASEARENSAIAWPGCRTLQVADGLKIHFLPITSDFHLAHYKPDFMLALMEGPATNADGIAYFDPDIVIRCKWKFYENWMTFGVAIIHEIVSNDMPPSHPTRKEWEKVISLYNKSVTRKLYSYLNCGFCGVAKQNKEFLTVWSDIINIAIHKYDMDPSQFATFDRTSIFWSIDQDAFNIAAMCCDSPISEIGAEGMDFIATGWTMSHATGSPKPWSKNYILSALNGNPPTRAEKEFWTYTSSPIIMYSNAYLIIKRVIILITAFIGRFYRRY